MTNSLKSKIKKTPVLKLLLKVYRRFKYNRFIKLKNILSNNYIWMYLRHDSHIERNFLKNGIYGEWEKESLKIWAELCKKSNHILDIGANTGTYSLIAKSQNSHANVYAIEPIDLNFDILSKNIQKNEFKIHAEKVALSGKEGVAKMFMLKDRLNYMTSINDNRYEGHPELTDVTEVVEIEVPIKTFEYLSTKYSIPKVDLIKIDVEGHELDVLKNMQTVIARDKPTILIEVIGDENAKLLHEMFSSLDYKYISIDEKNKSFVSETIWDNDHHNFLLCDEETISYLRSKKLVV